MAQYVHGENDEYVTLLHKISRYDTIRPQNASVLTDIFACTHMRSSTVKDFLRNDVMKHVTFCIETWLI